MGAILVYHVNLHQILRFSLSFRMFPHSENNLNDSTKERKQDGIHLIYQIQFPTN